MTRIGTSNLDVFPLNLGGNTFGWTADSAASEEILDGFVAGGGNFIDTADAYSAWVPGNTGGESEKIIGAWMKARGNRASTIVATKVSQHPEFKGLSASNIAAAAEASLDRLQSDYIDLYYAHFDDQTPMEEIAGAFDALVKAGKIRNIGISNFSAERIEEWMTVAAREGFTLPVALQPHYNLVNRTAYETELAPVVARHNLGVMPYYSLASGFLTGKYRTEADLAGKARGQGAGEYLNPRGLSVIGELESISTVHHASIASTALAWLRAQPGVVAPVASASVVGQLPDLLNLVELTSIDIELLNNVSIPVDGNS
jgi:aryl-alcohol dehydrogenase-like predicted oxidoreductase